MAPAGRSRLATPHAVSGADITSASYGCNSGNVPSVAVPSSSRTAISTGHPLETGSFPSEAASQGSPVDEAQQTLRSRPASMGGEAPSRAPSSLPKMAAHPVGQHIRDIYLDRLRQFTARGQYEGQNLVS